ncbi:MAG TPA: MauE/DoxX family redox-associated membrane protein [Acidimicrobiales bacterium]|nr:MauE/DoxX family redox-associated membrane protein [Acidimicrobiales bacterium]
MLTALVGAGALLLLAAGAAKVADPSRTAGALAALAGRPVPALLVRAGAVVEAALGAAALVVGGRVPAALVGLSYLAFAGVVVAAQRAGTPIGSCGCFGGRADTPPRPAHVVVDAGLAAAALAAAAVGVDPLVEGPAWTAVAALVAALAAYAVLTAAPGAERRPSWR